jgi:hypothetical protein
VSATGNQVARVSPAVFLLIVVYGMALLNGGYLHYEGQFFLSAFLDDRDFLHKIFSARFADWGCYQGRELSFVFGWADAQFIALSTRLAAPHLYSITTIAATLGTGIVLWDLLPRIARGLDRLQSALLVALLLATPAAALSGYYYRPAKAMAAFLFVLLLREAAVMLAPREKSATPLRALSIFIIALMMGLSDRQGVALIIATAIVITIVEWPIKGNARTLLFALGAAFILNVLWSRTLGPALALWSDGIPPDTADEAIRFRQTFGRFIHFAIGASLWRDQLGFYFGNSGTVGAALAVIAGTAALVPSKASRTANPRARRIFLAVCVSAAIALALYTAMWIKLVSLSEPGSARVYYWLPTTVSLAIVSALAIGATVARYPRTKTPLTVLLGIMLTTSILSLPGHAAIIDNGRERERILEAPRLRTCMGSPSTAIADASLSPAGAEVCARVRLAAFGTAGPGPLPPRAQPNPVLYCKGFRKGMLEARN